LSSLLSISFPSRAGSHLRGLGRGGRAAAGDFQSRDEHPSTDQASVLEIVVRLLRGIEGLAGSGMRLGHLLELRLRLRLEKAVRIRG